MNLHGYEDHSLERGTFQCRQTRRDIKCIHLVQGNEGQIRLTIRDEGAGFPVGAVMNRQEGLMNVRHRLSLMRCEMQIHSNPGKGTQIMINIPKQQVK